MKDLDRITFEPGKMGGKACIRGMRITVSHVLRMLGSGMTREEILQAYPYLEPADIDQCIQYAAYLAEDRLYPISA
jgi:uncharacterized protein (DUF433 family)